MGAHEIKEDQNYSVQLHINPNDTVIVNQPAEIFIDIRDNDNERLDTSICDCWIAFYKDDIEITQQGFGELWQVDNSLFYTFEKVGNHKITIYGAPFEDVKDQDGVALFTPFSQDFNIEVLEDRGTEFLYVWIIGALIAVTGVGFLLRQTFRK